MKKTYDDSEFGINYQRHLIKATVSANKGIDSHEQLIRFYGKGANRIEILKKLEKNSKFKLWWYIIFITLGLICVAIDYNSWINVLDLFIVMINIDLNSRGKLSGTVVGIIECFVYAFISFQSKLYGEIIRTIAICVPLNIYAIISWKLAEKKAQENKYKNDDEIIIKRLTKKQKFAYVAFFIALFALSYVFLKYALSQTTALLTSAISLAIMILTKFLFAKQYMESWIVGILGNIICMLMWGQTILETGLSVSEVSMIIYYLACLSNDTFAYMLWKNMYRKVTVNGGVLLAMRNVKIKRIAKLKRQFRRLHWDKFVDIQKNS